MDPSTPASGLAFTVGHSSCTAEELAALLQENGVDTLVDVRRFPGSRRHPHFNRGRLEATLKAKGIGYRHSEALGGRRGEPLPDSPNTALNASGFRSYADHLGVDAQARTAVEEALNEAADRRLALMCAEADPRRCHRLLLADVLAVRGLEVRHILGPGRVEVHRPAPELRLLPDGRVVWVHDGARQEEIFSPEEGEE